MMLQLSLANSKSPVLTVPLTPTQAVQCERLSHRHVISTDHDADRLSNAEQGVKYGA